MVKSFRLFVRLCTSSKKIIINLIALSKIFETRTTWVEKMNLFILLIRVTRLQATKFKWCVARSLYVRVRGYLLLRVHARACARVSLRGRVCACACVCECARVCLRVRACLRRCWRYYLIPCVRTIHSFVST